MIDVFSRVCHMVHFALSKISTRRVVVVLVLRVGAVKSRALSIPFFLSRIIRVLPKQTVCCVPCYFVLRCAAG